MDEIRDIDGNIVDNEEFKKEFFEDNEGEGEKDE